MQPLIREFDRHLTQDLRDLADAVLLLDLGEHEVFKAAYRWWFGAEPSDADVKRPFADYLRGLALPIWVRQFCREVLQRAAQDGVNPRDPAFGGRWASVRGLYPGQASASAVTFAAFMIYLFILL